MGAPRGIAALQKCWIRNKSAAGDGAQTIQQRGKAGSNSWGFSFCRSRREDNISCWDQNLPASPNSSFPCRTNTLQKFLLHIPGPEHFPSWHSRVLPGTLQGGGLEGSRQDMKLKTGKKKKKKAFSKLGLLTSLSSSGKSVIFPLPWWKSHCQSSAPLLWGQSTPKLSLLELLWGFTGLCWQKNPKPCWFFYFWGIFPFLC